MSLSSHSARESSNYADDTLGYLCALPGMAATIHSDLPLLRRCKRSTLFVVNGIRYRHELNKLLNLFASSSLASVLELSPIVLEKPFSPYVLFDWNRAVRTEQLENHFLFLQELFGENCKLIYTPQGYRIFEFKSLNNERYYIELFPGYQNEGSLGIRLCDRHNREVYTVSLHLSGAQEKSCYIGALQGPNDRIPHRQETIVSLTRSMHGLRPKALMIEVLYMLAKSLGLEQIYGVSNAGSIYNASVYAKKTNSIKFDRDQMWREYRAEPMSEMLFKFPERPIRKDIGSLKPNKRSMYRKRYAWLSNVAKEVEAELQKIKMSNLADSASELRSAA